MEKAHIVFHRQERVVASGLTLRETLERLGIDAEQVVPLRNRQVITATTTIMPGDEIKLVNVVAGG